ncbi:YhdH/YhfP family quinone oxidoreductase [Zooshikella harenae]|uniref:YhdH/YhfP family quinone oxidoreductase n=1 Tax=Zooshikella harenae TaxID=2827238 RepID=A0ABS5ZC28_9GAMM|nr:YhdH/YhfP family quinone oxidoreductase [Zooshikella harenae]MBU2711619.1 YhdH/YhfP family quinone oxidoreductase [Zooshikella harenae]
MTQFKALWVEKDAKQNSYVQRIVTRDTADLPTGEVLIRVHYSSLNFKDALSAMGNRGVTKHYPHTPGVDASGIVVSSDHPDWQAGQEVIVTGYDLGMNTPGGFGQYIRVPAQWLVPLPAGLSLYDAMALGTAGLTAALCINKLLRMGLTPESGYVFVTGATGGVGSLSVSLLNQLGYSVAASTGKLEQADYLSRLGANMILDRETLFEGNDKPLLKPRWAAAIDTVGGDILFNVIKSLQYGGMVACCGMVASPEFSANVYPFILRSVSLLGVDSVEEAIKTKQLMWQKLASEWRIKVLPSIAREIPLTLLPEYIQQIFRGKVVGRVVVNMQSV